MNWHKLVAAAAAITVALGAAGCSSDDVKPALASVAIPTFSSTGSTTSATTTSTTITSTTVEETVTSTVKSPPAVTVTKRHTVTATAAPSSANPVQAAPKPQAVKIPLGEACRWAYHAQASGVWSGSVYSVVCLGQDGSSLGGFPDGSGHSLNDWCAYPAHTQGADLRQAKFRDDTPEGWECEAIQ
jgi:hypothetical protein